jgi:hypothetical protein
VLQGGNDAMTQSTSEIIQLLKTNREEIFRIAAKHGACNVRILGSVARGEESDRSDIDFLVDYDLERISPWFPAGLVLDLEQLLGCNVNVTTELALEEHIREQVLEEAVLL